MVGMAHKGENLPTVSTGKGSRRRTIWISIPEAISTSRRAAATNLPDRHATARRIANHLRRRHRYRQPSRSADGTAGRLRHGRDIAYAMNFHARLRRVATISDRRSNWRRVSATVTPAGPAPMITTLIKPSVRGHSRRRFPADRRRLADSQSITLFLDVL